MVGAPLDCRRWLNNYGYTMSEQYEGEQINDYLPYPLKPRTTPVRLAQIASRYSALDWNTIIQNVFAVEERLI